MAREEIPKKFLLIKECTFILPDDFDGSLEDAFTEFLKYRASHLPEAGYYDELGLFSTYNLLVHAKGDPKVCGQYMLCELDDGHYKILDGTRPCAAQMEETKSKKKKKTDGG